MPEVRERDVYNALLKFKGEGSIEIGEAEIRLSLAPVDVHTVGRPDSILWLEVSLGLFGQDLKLRIPVPIEAEKNGIADAMDDLEGFVARGQYIAEIPMLVVAEAGYGRREVRRDFPVEFTLTQIPVRRLKE